ncbi:MAG: helix-turn-helix domain-containing protein [Candidatus Gastranaerophilales bacterium]|nr:helix-turn-helix domain-containing protein [Candidatus Gastranaerophilales bacterium]
MMSLKEKLGARIQEIRKSKKLTQEKLAEKIGLDTPNLSNIERGKRFVSAETLEKIVKALDVTEKDLFDFGHIDSKESIINSINEILINSNEKEVQFCYKFLLDMKQL